ncbi:MAG: T9SS type A sorting domain-containing protein, partial [Bacteroidota bacterium]
VQQSLNGIDWEDMGMVEGAGNSNVQKGYSFTLKDRNFNAYYRIKQTDFDGQFSYTPVILVSQNADKSLDLYPNPSSGIVYVNSLVNTESIRIFNALGTEVTKLVVKENKSTGNMKLDFSSLVGGVYIVRHGSAMSRIVFK